MVSNELLLEGAMNINLYGKIIEAQVLVSLFFEKISQNSDGFRQNSSQGF